MPILNWIGKDAVVNHDKEVSFRLLKKIKTKSIGESENLIIEGDNLEALKSLLPYYQNKIKCVYIDPPYNTGNENWIYNDNVNSPKIRQWLGKVVGSEGDDLTRHDKWLCMMYPRLKLLKELLSDEGSIFIQISDVEEHNLRTILDEIFYPENFINRITVKTRSPSGFQSVNPGVYETAEYIFIYAKNKKKWQFNKQFVKIHYDSAYNKVVLNKSEPTEKWKIESIKETVAKELGYKSSSEALKKIHPCVFDLHIEEFALKNADSVFQSTAISDSGAAKETVDLKIKSLKNNKIFVQKRKELNDRFIHKGREMSFYSKKIRMIDGTETPSAQLTNIWTDISWEGIANEGNVKLKKGKKPLKLIERIIEMSCNDNDIVLDSFAGTGTTGHAVIKLNHEKNINRKFILVELESKIAKDVTYKRISFACNDTQNLQGFQYCVLDKSLFDENGKINPDCTFEELASYIYFTETKTILDTKNINKTLLGNFNDTEYYLIFNGIGKNNLDRKFLTNLDQDKNKVIYADKCTLDNSTLEKHHTVFKQIPYEVREF